MGNKHRLQMQRRKEDIRQPKPSNRAPNYEYDKPEHEDTTRHKINQYICWTCGGAITTIDRDYGVTPAMLACRATLGCKGNMHSQRYMVDQTLIPEYEWFRPHKLPRDPGMRQHIQMGGLDIRRIES